MELEKSAKLKPTARDVEEIMKRIEILEQHPYKIWQGADGRWYTKVKTDGKLKILKKTKRDDLDDAIVSFYRKSDDKNTLAAIYPDWLQYKNCGDQYEQCNQTAVGMGKVL
ncbi:MAG: hypothetical protein LIO96_06560 [Lachnospiraceae bacterium]|nr:hypothetical protein [Lachnospiraceae bacterium]